MAEAAAVRALAERLADEELFPRALETDAAETLPRERLDALAESGLYGLGVPDGAGGLEVDSACSGRPPSTPSSPPAATA